MESQEFKSPVRKLIRFFRSSRDRWKGKYHEAQRKNKRWSNQVRAVEKSRDHWKEKAKAEAQCVRRLERELEAVKNPGG